MNSSVYNSIRDWIKSQPTLRNFARIFRTKIFGDLSWSRFADNIQEEKKSIIKRPNILVATSFGGEVAITAVESLLSAALTVRGANVHVLLCDGIAACQLCDITRFSSTKNFVENGLPKYVCKACCKAGMKIYGSLALTTHKMSDYLDEADLEFARDLAENHPVDQIKVLKINSVPVGEHAFAGTCRYFAKADFSDEPYKESVLRKYLYSALLVMRSTQKLMNEIDYTCVLLNHGIYIPQGVIAEVARHNKTRIVTWNTAYRKQCFIFSHNDTYHHELMYEPNSNWENIELNKETDHKITKYIESRSVGINDWISFNNVPRSDDENLRTALNIENNKKIVTMYTNVMWDAQ
ncbi:hypothetical protein N9V66_06390, partial [Amylibacter sp.]|nr:hypothetical protein [Amylibacter sp.]